MKLGDRLKTIADLVPPAMKVADIGTDHGYLCAYLAERGDELSLFASDLNPGPLKAAEETFKEAGLLGQVALRLGPGFSPYTPGELDCAVIAGMGGHLIAQIIADHHTLASQLKTLILQPMQAPEALRAYLLTHGFVIKRECIAREGQKFYEIIQCSAGDSQALVPIKQEIGYVFDETPEYKAFLEFRLRRHQLILASLLKQDPDKHQKALSHHKAAIRAIEEVLHAGQF